MASTVLADLRVHPFKNAFESFSANSNWVPNKVMLRTEA
jgi:hypothetical protein